MSCIRCDLSEILEQTRPPDPELVDLIEQAFVEGQVDGETFTLLTSDKQQVKIRLAEIDAPETSQPYGNKSKQALSGLIFGKDIRVVVQTTDRYGITVGRPYVGNLDVCEEMVRVGAAWVYRQYVID